MGLAGTILQGGVWQDIIAAPVLGMDIDRDGKFIAVGEFTLAGGQCASRVAMWVGVAWVRSTSVGSLTKEQGGTSGRQP